MDQNSQQIFARSKLKILNIAALIVLAIASCCSAAYAFSEDGFHDGMGIEEVQTKLGYQGSQLTAKHEADGFVSFVTDRGGHRQFIFCKDQLVGYSRALSGFTEFTAVLERETKSLGDAHYTASVDENIGGFAPPEQHNRAYSFLDFNWTTPDGVTGVRIAEVRGPKASFRDKRLPGDWLLDVSTDFAQFWGTKKSC